MLATAVKSVLRPVARPIRLACKRNAIARQAQRSPVRVVLGAGSTRFDRWISTDIDTLNISREQDWRRYFRPESIDAMLAEHVWEHLTPEDAVLAAQLCFRHLKPGGYLRVAVPDGDHPSEDYIWWVTQGGPSSGSEDHKVLYNRASLAALFEAVGFRTRLLEYHDDHGALQSADWDPDQGLIRRSSRFDSLMMDNPDRPPGMVYTSLILDAIKPRIGH